MCRIKQQSESAIVSWCVSLVASERNLDSSKSRIVHGLSKKRAVYLLATRVFGTMIGIGIVSDGHPNGGDRSKKASPTARRRPFNRFWLACNTPVSPPHRLVSPIHLRNLSGRHTQSLILTRNGILSFGVGDASLRKSGIRLEIGSVSKRNFLIGDR